jgi:hypothetical protein
MVYSSISWEEWDNGVPAQCAKEAKEIKSHLFLCIETDTAEQIAHDEVKVHLQNTVGICYIQKLDTFRKPKVTNTWKATVYQIIEKNNIPYKKL